MYDRRLYGSRAALAPLRPAPSPENRPRGVLPPARVRDAGAAETTAATRSGAAHKLDAADTRLPWGCAVFSPAAEASDTALAVGAAEESTSIPADAAPNPKATTAVARTSSKSRIPANETDRSGMEPYPGR